MEDLIFELLKNYTYEPLIVYSLVTIVMVLSSLGLPLPEEVSIISLGVLSYMGAHPELYPPPYEGASSVQMVPSMIVCAGSIFFSDFVVYTIGRTFGSKIFASPWFKRMVSDEKLDKVKAWARRWGSVVPGLFRLIPGVRFPGHLICGALGIRRTTFALVDGLVVLIIVPTQIFLIAYYGETVIDIIKRFQMVIMGICVLIFVGLFWNFYKMFSSKAN